MKKYKDVTAVCFLASTYSMLLYIMVYGKKQFETTFFFVSDAISEDVQEKMLYHKYLSYKKMVNKTFFERLFYRLILYRTSYLRWPFLKKLPIFGGDHLWFTSALLKKRSMVVLEDGLANYDIREVLRTTQMKHKCFYRWVYGPIIGKGEYGYSSQARELILSGIAPTLDCVKDKTKVVNIYDLWKKTDAQELIKELFNLTESDIFMLKKKNVIILTQPYNVDIGDDALIDIYRKIINKYNSEEIVIKTHPRDTIDFAQIFPDVTVYSKKIPAELFALIGVEFSNVYTINSTSIFSFPQETNLHYLGYECHPLLLKKYGKDVVGGPST